VGILELAEVSWRLGLEAPSGHHVLVFAAVGEVVLVDFALLGGGELVVQVA